MAQFCFSRRLLTIVTFLALSIASAAASTAHAQESCNSLGPVRHHVTFDQVSPAKGFRLGVSYGIRNNALALRSFSSAFLDSFPIGASNQLTVGMWVKPNYFADPQSRFISQASGLDNADHDFMVSTFQNTGLRFRLRIDNVTHQLISPAGLLTPFSWNHVAVTYSGSRMVIYHNGKAVASKAVSGNLTFRSSITGIGNQPPGAGSRIFVGSIDELVVFNNALNPQQVALLGSASGVACSENFASAAGDQTPTSGPASPSTPAAPAPRAAPPPPTLPPVPRVAPLPQPTPPAQPNSNPTTLTSNLPVYSGSQWPASNDKLPMGGLFYGVTKAGMMSGNGPISAQNAIRFRAQRSGPIKAVRYNNRTLRQTDIDYRCEIYGPTSVWCKCKYAGLDNLSCGYTLANSYHVGNGGLITIEIRDNDSASGNLPGPNVLGMSAAFIPTNQYRKFPTVRLRQQVNLEAGKLYHIVFRNDRPPTNCKFRSVPIAQARNCQRDRGAIGINGTQHATDPTSLRPFGPFLGSDGSGLLAKYTNGSAWTAREGVVPYYEVQYADGTYAGETYAGYDNTNYALKNKGTRDVEGANMAEQVFTVTDANRRVDGLWVNYGHSFVKRANGTPMNVTLKSGNIVLATGSIPASMACSDIATKAAWVGGRIKKLRETRDDWMCRTWGYTNWSETVDLVVGQTYSVVFTAQPGAAFVLSSYFSYHGLSEVNIWENAMAQYSANSGQKWTEWSGNQFFMSRDLPIAFTIEGMPKQLP